MSVAVSYQLLSQNLTRSLAITANQGQVKIETEYYLENYGSIRSLDDFVADTRVFRYAMTAFGLSDMAYAKGYMRKILEEGVNDPSSLANRTTDPRIKEFARVFDFASFEDLTMTRSATGQAVVDRYVRQTMEETAGRDDGEGVRLALYFERMAPTVRNAYEILADKALSEVVRTVLGLPPEFGAADIDKQAAVIAERFEIEELRDPQKLDKILRQFTAIWDATRTNTVNPILSLFSVGQQPTVSIDLAMSLTTFRLGGA